MDDNDNHASLLHLPPEILGIITSMVTWIDLGHLEVVGNKLLSNKLCAVGGVTSVRIIPESSAQANKIITHWVPFFERFRSLETLAISPRGYNARLLGLDITRLPATLTCLRLSSKVSHAVFAPYDKPIDLATCLPHLVTFESRLKMNQKHIGKLPIMPPTLTTLGVEVWLSSIPLPDTLLRLSTRELVLDPEKALFPPTLTHFNLMDRLDGKMEKLISFLPPSVERFDIPFCSSDFHAKSISQLPRGVTALEARHTEIYSDNWLHEQTDLQLPPHLTKLIIPLIPIPELWKLLPATLTHLRWGSPKRTHNVPVLDEHWKTALAYLPKKLKVLAVPNPLQADETVWSEDLALPEDLEILEVDWLTLTGKAAASLPKRLRVLHSRKVTLEAMKLLPRSLTDVSSHLLEFGADFVAACPPSLQTLKGRFHTAFPNDAAMPNKSKCINEHDKLVRAWHPGLKFPVGFKKIDFDRCSSLGDEVVSALGADITFLSMAAARYITNRGVQSMASIAKSLTTLDFGDSASISGDCFQWLPKSLRFLELGASEQIHDHHIKFLPRELLYAYLNSAIHLTDNCFKTLPHFMQTLRIDKNILITVESLPLWPTSLRCSGSFYCAKFSCINGKINSK